MDPLNLSPINWEDKQFDLWQRHKDINRGSFKYDGITYVLENKQCVAQKLNSWNKKYMHLSKTHTLETGWCYISQGIFPGKIFDLRASGCSFSSLPSDPEVSFEPSVPDVSRDIVVVVSVTVSPPSTLAFINFASFCKLVSYLFACGLRHLLHLLDSRHGRHDDWKEN